MQVLASPIFNAFTQTSNRSRTGRRSLWSQEFVAKLSSTGSSLRSMDTRWAFPYLLLPLCVCLMSQTKVDLVEAAAAVAAAAAASSSAAAAVTAATGKWCVIKGVLHDSNSASTCVVFHIVHPLSHRPHHRTHDCALVFPAHDLRSPARAITPSHMTVLMRRVERLTACYVLCPWTMQSPAYLTSKSKPVPRPFCAQEPAQQHHAIQPVYCSM